MSSTPAESLRPSRLEILRRRKIILFFTVVAFVLGCAAATPWIMDWWKMVNARDLASEAGQRLEEKDYKAAMPLLVKAWQITPGDARVLRGLGRACDATPSAAPDAAVFWRRLAESGVATTDDQVSLAASLLKVSDPIAARKVMDAIPEDQRHSLHHAEVLAALLRSEGHEKEATDTLRAAWLASPDDPACRLKLAMLDYDSPFEPIHEAARKALWEVARGGSEPGVEALKAIAASPELTFDKVPELRRLLDANPRIDALTRLRLLSQCVRKFPQLAGDFVEQEAPRVEAQKLEDRTEFYEWVARLGDDSRIINDLTDPADPKDPESARKPKAAVLRSRDLFLACGDALIRAARWRDFADILELHDLPISPTDAELMRAMSAHGLGREVEDIDKHLRVALDSARISHVAGETGRVADVAERLARPALAVEACLAVETDNSTRLENQRRILRLQQQLKDSEGMLRTTQSILTSSPGLSGFVEQMLYLKILTGREIESSAQEAAASAESSSLRKLSAAIASYEEGDLAAVRAQIATVRSSDLDAGPRAVLAGLLAKTGAGGDGFQLAEKIPVDSVLPEEQWFLKLAMR